MAKEIMAWDALKAVQFVEIQLSVWKNHKNDFFRGIVDSYADLVAHLCAYRTKK